MIRSDSPQVIHTRLLPWVLAVWLALAACSAAPTSEPGPGPAGVNGTEREASGAHLETPEGADAAELSPSPVADSSGPGLEGRLIYLQFSPDGQRLQEMDLETGAVSTLFAPEAGSWMVGAAASPEVGMLALAYAPAPGEGQVQTGFTGLSLLPLAGGTSPEPWQEFVPEKETYASPHWAPDGERVYFSRFVQDETSPEGFLYQIARRSYPEGAVEVLVDGAIWPRLSRDGEMLAFVSFEAEAAENELFVLDLTSDTREPRQIQLPESIFFVDAPLFSPDGEWLYFSAPEPVPQVTRSWLDQLLGVQIARAHDVPSDWWRVPISGGEPERVTELQATGLYGDFSPDGRHIAFLSSLGLHVMAPDGSGLMTLLEASDLFGTLAWIP